MAERHQTHAGEEKIAGRRRQASERATPTSHASPLHPVLRLQRQVGNQAVAGLLAQRQAAEEEEDVQMKRDTAVQRVAEEEEDTLQAKHEPAVQRAAAEEEELQAKHDSALQRAAEEEEELQARHDPVLQRKPEVGLEGGPVSESTAQQIQATRGSGQPLDQSTRSSMEHAFGESFADVRLHTNRQASDLNFRLGAQAFTTGNDIFLRDDVYRPGTQEGQHLLAHELTHVVQQRSMQASGGMEVRPAGDAYEQAADATASQVVARLAQGVQRTADEEE